MNCEHLKDGACSLGLYGGKPYFSNCLACVAQGNNNPDFARALFASRETTHPPTPQRVSGCCDSALNPAFDIPSVYEPSDPL